MENSIGVERVYNLGDYKSLRISSHISNIPENLLLNYEFMEKLRGFQLLEIERTFYKYINLSKDLIDKYEEDHERLEAISEISSNIFVELLELYKNSKEGGTEDAA